MRKRWPAMLLSLLMLISAVSPTAFALEDGPPNAGTWFYNQLTAQGKAIYAALAAMYDGGSGIMKDGRTSYDLVEHNVIDWETVGWYLMGNQTLFNDFTAAKDAFDLEHPEAWYIDSSDLSLLASVDEDAVYHAYIGPGRTEDYYIEGVTGAADAAEKSNALKSAVMDIVNGAGKSDSAAKKVEYVHKRITESISYRFENECTAGNAGYIRTAYALVTHEGVCEGYAHAFQYVMNELEIPCVLIHGVQTEDDPENHMWCAVWLADESGGAWYAVDPTWDDPIVLDAEGNIKDLYPETPGRDGGERDTYLLVGQDVIGAYWQPSGYVSTGSMEFTYPDIAPRSYSSKALETNGLKVSYKDDLMEGYNSTVYQVSFNGDGLVQSAKKGYYFLVRLYDLNADGSMDVFDDWYYAVHDLHGISNYEPYELIPDNDFQNTGNPYYYDTNEYMVQSVSNCEYVEFAVTTTAPPDWKYPMDLITMGGYYSGDGSDIIAQTGLIYNPNGNYDQPPYVKNVSPQFNSPVYVGKTYLIHMEFTEPLYHPDQDSIDSAEKLGKVNDAEQAKKEAVTLNYRGTTYAWGVQARMPHTFAYKPDPQNVRWTCDTHKDGHTGENWADGIDASCRLTALDFEFSASQMWADDSVEYEFYLTGLIGAKSNQYLRSGAMSYVFENLSAYCSYRCSQGIDWNLWGQPQLLDNPNNLDFSKMTVEDTDSDGIKNLEQLRASMHLDDVDMNGRLVLAVENLDANRPAAEAMADLIAKEENSLDILGNNDAVLGSSLYEIDFARICSKTIVETGQSLRMQIGFPAGIDPSMSGLVFKVYHFTRGADGTINGVEEIPVTVTPYGLVILVNSFSPFAIVAVDANQLENLDAGTDRCVVLTSEGHGTITSDYREDTRTEVSSTVKFEADAASGSNTHTFTITPEKAYVLDTISYSGLNEGAIEWVDDNTFTLQYDGISETNAIINVTFARDSGQAIKIHAVCSHSNASGGDYTAPTCTEDGFIAEKTCNECHQVLYKAEVIPASGHAEAFSGAYKAPTCTQDGSIGEVTCRICHETLDEDKTIAALGHDYVAGKCTRCGDEVVHTVTFIAEGGVLTGRASAVADENGRLSSLPVPTRDGYEFDGWYTADGTKVTTDTQFTKSTTIYARWTEIPAPPDQSDPPAPSDPAVYTITLNTIPAWGGSVTGNGTYDEGQSITVDAVPASDYRFSYWMKDGAAVSTDTAYTFTAAADQTLTAVFERIIRPNIDSSDSSNPGGNSSDSGGPPDSNNSTTVTTENPDGSITTTVIDPATGAVMETTAYPDGMVIIIETAANGIQITTVYTPGAPVTVFVVLPANMDTATVTIPAAVTPGTVAVDAVTGEIIRHSVPTAEGLRVKLTHSASFILEDRSKTFSDTNGHWAKDSIAFVTAHGLFSGTGETTFEPSLPMTRAMLMTVLARLDGAETEGGSIWYEKGMTWAVSSGVSDGSNPDGQITREQLAVMLWRYAGAPAVDGSLALYPDAGDIDDWAASAMIWAVRNGIINGSDDGRLNPLGNALRSEVAAILTRFCQNIEY